MPDQKFADAAPRPSSHEDETGYSTGAHLPADMREV